MDQNFLVGKSDAHTAGNSSLAQLDANKRISSKRQPQSPRDHSSHDRQRRQKHKKGGASAQLTLPKEESTFSIYKDDSPSTPPTDWFLLGLLDQQTDVHPGMTMPSAMKPFQSHSGTDITLPSLLDCGQPGFADDPGTNVIQQSQEEVGGDYTQRGRHEIVLGNVTVVVESIMPHSR